MQEIEKFIPVCNQYDVVYDSWGTQLDDEEDLEEDETAPDDK
jgi:regulator of RNase E activity RraB